MNYSTGKLRRSSSDKLLGGICRPIADLVKVDVGIVRIIAVVLALVTSGTAALIYLIAWAVLPAEGDSETLLDNLIQNGKEKYDQYKATKSSAQPSSQPGPAPSQTSRDETFNPYADN